MESLGAANSEKSTSWGRALAVVGNCQIRGRERYAHVGVGTFLRGRKRAIERQEGGRVNSKPSPIHGLSHLNILLFLFLPSKVLIATGN